MKMYRVISSALFAGAFFSTGAAAASLPAIKTSANNQVPACATPGRLMAFAVSRNSRMADKFDAAATQYMRHGEALKLRWDYAFFQMLVETGNLSFTGDVNASQNNFAGLGATGGGAPGERFDNLSDGVKAHLQHVLMYSGDHVTDPVAERTRKVQEWGVLTKWQRRLLAKGPVTFADLTRQWSPSDRGYARDIAAVADAFYGRFCNIPDPRPQLVAEARGTGVSIDTTAALPNNSQESGAKGRQTAQKAIADARENSGSERLSLGAGSIGTAMQANTPSSTKSTPPTKFTVLNGAGNAAPEKSTSETTKTAFAVGAAAGAGASAAMPDTKDATPASTNCRVWQASYGGERAVIIKASDKDRTNYTVLDVNAGREQREVAAYIAAYAKNGKSLGTFNDSNTALNKAFELCPEN